MLTDKSSTIFVEGKFYMEVLIGWRDLYTGIATCRARSSFVACIVTNAKQIPLTKVMLVIYGLCEKILAREQQSKGFLLNSGSRQALWVTARLLHFVITRIHVVGTVLSIH